MSAEHTDSFKKVMRMSKEQCHYILTKIEKDVTPRPMIGVHEIINVKAWLALTLRFLATGETYRSIRFQFRIFRAATSYIIVQASKAIRAHTAEYMAVITTTRECLTISTEFEER